jgi:hypothetical protein
MANPHPVGRRKPGVPNKFGPLRAAAVEREGKLLPPANLLVIAENSMAMAARYQPELVNPETKERQVNPRHNEERYAFWLAAAREANKAAAPYYAPRLHAIAVQTVPGIEGKDEAGYIDPRQLLFEMYMQMRERGQITLEALPAPTPTPKPSGNGSAPEPAKVEEDDADGVAA